MLQYAKRHDEILIIRDHFGAANLHFEPGFASEARRHHVQLASGDNGGRESP